MTVDELIKQLINAQLIEQLGVDCSKFRSYIDGQLNKTNITNSNDIIKLKSDIKAYSDANEKIMRDLEQRIGSRLETIVKKFNENQSLFGQQINNKIAGLEAKIANIGQNYQKLEKEYYSISQKISALESKNNVSPGTVRVPSRTANELFDQNDTVINSFNNWASYPGSNLPGEFTYVTGDFRIRTDRQEFTETREETKWIINRRGTKTYLLPNPNSFNQMTNLDLYEMDLSMLKEKGKNKIKIITPCEISSSGFIEFKGKLQIVN